MKDATKIVLITAAVVVGVMVFFWAIGWIGTPLEKTSSSNVQKQWAFAYEYDESLRAVAAQYCAAEKALNDSTADDEKIQRRSHLLAIEQNYSRIQAKYDAKLRNAFEAKYIRPSDVPDSAPTLTALVQRVCR